MPRSTPRLVTAIGVTAATLGVLLASGLTWGTHEVTIPPGLGGGIGEFTSTGWSGHLLLGPLRLANRLVPFAAGIVCWSCWLRLARIGGIPAVLPIAFNLYGLAHTGAIIFVYSGGHNAVLGPGAPLCALAFLVSISLLILELRSPGTTLEARAS